MNFKFIDNQHTTRRLDDVSFMFLFLKLRCQTYLLIFHDMNDVMLRIEEWKREAQNFHVKSLLFLSCLPLYWRKCTSEEWKTACWSCFSHSSKHRVAQKHKYLSLKDASAYVMSWRKVKKDEKKTNEWKMLAKKFMFRNNSTLCCFFSSSFFSSLNKLFSTIFRDMKNIQTLILCSPQSQLFSNNRWEKCFIISHTYFSYFVLYFLVFEFTKTCLFLFNFIINSIYVHIFFLASFSCLYIFFYCLFYSIEALNYLFVICIWEWIHICIIFERDEKHEISFCEFWNYFHDCECMWIHKSDHMQMQM